MKLYHKEHYVKLIPSQYMRLENITDYLESEHEKQLSPRERKNILLALLQQQVVQELLPLLKKSDPLVLEQIQDAKPIKAYQVTTNDRQKYYVVEFNNRTKVRCAEAIFRISPVKVSLKYAACLQQTRIPPPVREQLQLFP